MSDSSIGYRGILLGGKLLWNIVVSDYGPLLELCSRNYYSSAFSCPYFIIHHIPSVLSSIVSVNFPFLLEVPNKLDQPATSI